MQLSEADVLLVLSRHGHSSIASYSWTYQPENELRKILTNCLPTFLADEYPEHPPGGDYWTMYERIELNTLRFAMDRRISFTQPAWRSRARHEADEKDIVLNTYKRPARRPGRRDLDNPRFTTRNPLHRREELRLLLDFQGRYERAFGIKLSDAKAIEIMLTKLEDSELAERTLGMSDDAKALEKPLYITDPDMFANKVKRFRDEVSSQRQAAGLALKIRKH